MKRVSSIKFLLFLLMALPAFGQQQPPNTNGVLWRQPEDISSLNLFWGPGGKENQPPQPAEFEKEDRHGTSPKFDVHDAAGKKWGAKLGLEAKPETAAARLMWAAGYAANENYFFPVLHVNNMPGAIRHGKGMLGQGGDVPNVRLQRRRDKLKKIGDWNWRHNPFYGKREFNGLRVMMALIANWDLKDDNNAILQSEKEPGPQIYEVTDVGTAFGTPGKRYTDKDSKGNLPVYRQTKLIAHVHGDYVDLNFPKRPPLGMLFEFEWAFFFHQVNMRWVGKHIPRSDAKWIGSLLAQLSDDQLKDAFRAAGYSDQEVGDYAAAVRSRIQELNSL